jgi:hypothetical protein
MIGNPHSIVPPLVATQTIVPASAESPPTGETTMPPATAEQVRAADRVFSAAAQPHPLVTLLGVATSFVLLRDLTVDTFDTTGTDDEREEERSGDEDEDSATNLADFDPSETA